jgi:hypothetical protein
MNTKIRPVAFIWISDNVSCSGRRVNYSTSLIKQLHMPPVHQWHRGHVHQWHRGHVHQWHRAMCISGTGAMCIRGTGAMCISGTEHSVTLQSVLSTDVMEAKQSSTS